MKNVYMEVYDVFFKIRQSSTKYAGSLGWLDPQLIDICNDASQPTPAWLRNHTDSNIESLVIFSNENIPGVYLLVYPRKNYAKVWDQSLQSLVYDQYILVKY